MEFFKYTLTEKDKEYCLFHAKKMAEGFSTYSFKNDQDFSKINKNKNNCLFFN
jgi:hypothetical protein